MGEAFSVPLSEAALRLLGDQMGERGKSPYVFPGRPRAPLSGMAMSMLLRRMGEFVTVHGFGPRSEHGAATSPTSSSRSRRVASATGSAPLSAAPMPAATCWNAGDQLCPFGPTTSRARPTPTWCRSARAAPAHRCGGREPCRLRAGYCTLDWTSFSTTGRPSSLAFLRSQRASALSRRRYGRFGDSVDSKRTNRRLAQGRRQGDRRDSRADRRRAEAN